jgi:two-component system heavy metal sensor histidine kinase CusS
MPLDWTGRRPISLAQRLTLSIGLTIAVVLLTLGWVIERSIARHFVQQDVEELEVVAHSVQHVLQAEPPGATADELSRQLAGAVIGHHGMFYRVLDPSGRTLFATAGSRLDALALNGRPAASIEADGLRTWTEQDHSYRGALVRLVVPGAAEPGYQVAVATTTSFHDHFLQGFRRTLWVATALAALFTILATRFAVYRGHAPLRDISARIRGLSASQLHVRLNPAEVPIELTDLTQSFNAMIERIEQDFRRLSNFSADIAHELRTPVTNLVTQTQVLLSKGRSVEAYRDVLYSNLEEYERMAKMIGDMLYLAQTDNHLIKPERAPVDLRTEVMALFEYFEPWAEERGVRLQCDGSVDPVAGDRLMLRRALSNLLSNAVRHTAAGATVTVLLAQDEQQVRVSVENPGADIPPPHLDHLFDRFYRVDPSRQHTGDGAGLGLAIVKSIIDAHGGHIAVRSSGGRTCFELSLRRQA